MEKEIKQKNAVFQEVEIPKSKKKLWIILGVCILFLVPVLTYIFRMENSPMQNPLSKNVAQLIPSPTPMPFNEITIPYLRDRTYTSTLGPLEELSQNANYTSFLTSYDSDGLKVNGLLTIPRDSSVSPQVTDSSNQNILRNDIKKYPAIIFIHGYIPPKQYQTTQNYASYVDYLARNGFVVFKIDLRGHANSEGEPSGAYYSSDYIIDTLNAYAALQKTDFVNPEKIGLWGHSMAGNVVMRSFAAKPTIPAVVVWAGAVYSYKDFGEYGISDSSYQLPQMNTERVRKRQQLLATYGEPKSGNQFWDLVAPTTFLDDLKGAVQLHHATNDNVVDIRYSKNLNEFLNKTSVEHEFHEYATGGHNLSDASFTQAMQQTVDFFKKHLTEK